MRILFCGDVVGRAGRKVVLQRLPELRAALALDAVVVNGENAAGGFGITPALCQDFYAAGADLITTGNHVFDQRDLVAYSERDPRLIRPLNMLPGTPGRGSAQVALPDGRRLLVLQVIGRLFMGQLRRPVPRARGRAREIPARRQRPGDRGRPPRRGDQREDGARPSRRRAGLAGRRHPYPRPDRRCADPAGRHRLRLRHRHDRRL